MIASTGSEITTVLPVLLYATPAVSEVKAADENVPFTTVKTAAVCAFASAV